MLTRAALAAVLVVLVVLSTATPVLAGSSIEVGEAHVSGGGRLGEVAHTIWFQGFVADPSSGEPVNATHDVVAEIFDAETDGVSLWGPETHPATGIVDGWFNIELGHFLAMITFDEPPYYLELTVNGEVLSPRLRLGSVPSALVSQGAVDADLDWDMNNDVVYRLTGEVGIGTSDPGAPLDVVASDYVAIHGTSTASGGTGYGVMGEAIGSGSIYGVAGYGFGSGSVYGVAGFGDHTGVAGHNNAVSTWGSLGTPSSGVVGSSGGMPELWAGYFDGNIHVTDSVGIGTESPSAELDVLGVAEVYGLRMVTGANEGYVLTCDGGGNASWEAPGSAADDGDWGFESSDIYLAQPGRVGIGTQYPDARLDVVARMHETNAMKVTNTNPGDVVHGIDISLTGDECRGLYSNTHSTAGTTWSVYAETFSNGGTVHGVLADARCDTGTAYGVKATAASGFAVADHAIGVYGKATTPSANSYGVEGYGGTWGVTGKNASTSATGSLGGWLSGVYGDDGGGVASHAGYFEGRIYTDSAMGVGILSPRRPLHVRTEEAGVVSYAVELENYAGIENSATGILFKVSSSNEDRGKGGIVYAASNTWNRGDFHILQDNNANGDVADLADAALTVTNNRDVGIGTTAPASKLEVAGMVHSTSGGFKFPDGSIQTTASPAPPAPARAAGNVVLDSEGAARVELPASVSAHGDELRYQLTCIGGFAPVYVAEKARGGVFTIAGGKPGMEVSWAVTGE